MKLVVIHGAPGVGKLTTARALAALTGFRVFHNHLAFDLARAVFDFPTPPFARLAETVRLATLEAAAREKVPGEERWRGGTLRGRFGPARLSRSTTRRSKRTRLPGASRATFRYPYAEPADSTSR